MDERTRKKIKAIQKGEITGYYIYNRLASREKTPGNKDILIKIAENEMAHYNIFKTYTKEDIRPAKLQVAFYTFLAVLFGLTFALKLMERGEAIASRTYQAFKQGVPEIEGIIQEEERHEKELLNLIDEKKLNYAGSIVLGLNDALVELSGALAGFTFAIQNSHTIALMGLITGVAATFSMAASEYLSKRQETSRKEALKSSLYTGISYVLTVVCLILPYFLIKNPFINLGVIIGIVIIIILFFNFYISIAKDLSFKRRFFEMALISLGVALLSFGIGWLVRTYLGLEI
ncbi:MAG: VIT1/CCC1 transporter family protein [Candidatus Heimdallarchaeota archaeon]|nr:VIT1/CCC1 transporter family protein [Candidatus Heimdallarchaeota archaeon]